MSFSLYGFWACLVAGLWTLWLIVLYEEKKGKRSVWSEGKIMDPLTRVVMAVMCAYCTVKAQKPGNANRGATNTPPTEIEQASGPASGLSGNSPAQQQSPAGALEGTQTGQLTASPEPSRIVLQSTLAADPAAIPAFSGEPGWSVPATVPAAPDLDVLSFDGTGPGIPSPVRFTNRPNATVQTVILAMRGNATNLATLVDSPVTARLRIAADGCPVPDMTSAERVLTEALTPGWWQISEVDLDQPAPLADLFFGGSAGRPGWLRNWRGEIAEAIGFNTPPGEDVRAGVANYLAIRWGTGGHPATARQRQAAIDAGLDYGCAWGTLFIFK